MTEDTHESVKEAMMIHAKYPLIREILNDFMELDGIVHLWSQRHIDLLTRRKIELL